MNRKIRFGLLLLLALPLPAIAHNGVDHKPHHGGTLKTYQNMHFETVLVPGGGLQVYFSEASGEQLPASTASQVAVEIERPGQKTEYVDLAIDPTGVFWMAKTKPITDTKSVLHVGFMTQGKSALVDVLATDLLAAGKTAKADHAH